MRSILSLSLVYCALTFASSASAQITVAPLTTFGGGDGWISPGDSDTDFLFSTGDTERGLGYNPITNHLYYVSRGNQALNIRILDATTGIDTGTPLDVTGISGGTFALNKIAVGNDGVIYGTNLRNGSGTATYRVYRWTAENTAPEIVFDAMPDTLSTTTTAGPRLGDTLDVIGSGAATRLVAGYGATTSPNANGYAVINPSASASTPTNPVFSNVSFPEGTGTGQTADGDFSRGITFVSGGASGTVIGTTGGATTSTRLTDYSDTTGTVRAKLTLQVASERIMDFATVGGVQLLATMEAGGSTTPLPTNGTIRLYDMSNPESPVFLTSITNMTGTPFANSNSAGDLRWGQINGNTATLYALNTNNGIQAFLVTVPEPSMAGLCSVGLLGLLGRRRHRS